MGEILGLAGSLAGPLLEGGGEAVGAAAPALFEAGAEAAAPLAITVGTNAYGPALETAAAAGGGGFFEGLGSFGSSALGAAGSMFSTPAGAAELPPGSLPDINLPTLETGAGGKPADVVGAGQQGELSGMMGNQPMGAPQSFSQPTSGLPGGGNPAADPAAAGAGNVPTPINQQPPVPTTTPPNDPVRADQVGGGAGGGSRAGLDMTPQAGGPGVQGSPTSLAAPSGAAGGAGTPAAPGGTPPASPGFFEGALGRGQGWLGPAIAGAGLGYSILQNNKSQVPSTSETSGKQSQLAGRLADQGQGLIGQGTALTQPVMTGTLPPAYQTAVDQATNAAIKRAISNAAAAGQPTDPNKNTALAQSIQQIQQNAVVQGAQLAQSLATTGQQLISSGTQMAGLQESIYQSLIQTDQVQSARMGTAISNFASALSGGPRNNVIQLGGTTQRAA